MKSDIEIASAAKPIKITKIAEKLGNIRLEQYGDFKGKVASDMPPRGKLILVTAVNPTPLGEGKTTVSIGLADALASEGHSVSLALREPSLGPVFGIKGGATGGGYAQVIPMDDINLHFTGDLHAITAANNLLCAIIDNHLQWGNTQKIKTVTFKRCIDLNDRALRNIVVGLGGATNGVPREDGFDITAASEIMAILCLSRDQDDLKKRLGDITVGLRADGSLVFCRDLKAEQALTILLKDAIKPNLVQTLEGTPAFIHGGPFANIAHGCNSIIATRTALAATDYVVTEAGFGADLGAEKFFDIKCRMADLMPSAVVLVATIKALKYNGGVAKEDVKKENVPALKKGIANLEKHIQNITEIFGLPCVVAINRYQEDTTQEINVVIDAAAKVGARAVLTEVFSKGGAGGIDLSRAVIDAVNMQSNFKFCYDAEQSYEEKLNLVATKVYGADGIILAEKAKKQLNEILNAGFTNLPICIAKTQYSLSDNPALLGRPKDFKITIRELKLRSGAGFVVALTGDVLLMPGLPKIPNSEGMEINGETIKGLF